ncbi:MAG TPA: SHOCT domain-containing protein [Gemmatimonadales bacterium]|nr:SHOCT domain-containing protein [Gemmatimonadales bacterium]
MASTAADEPGVSRALTALRSLLIPGEELDTHAVQRRLFALTHRRTIVGATSGRLIVVNRGLFGDYTPQDVRWQDLQDAQLRVGVFGASLSVSVHGNADLASAEGPRRVVQVDGLRKDEAQEVYRTCQAQEQAWREKRRVRELEELRAKSGGINLAGGMGATAGATAGDEGSQALASRLQRAKDMLQQGLLTDAEFEQIKARILSEL